MRIPVNTTLDKDLYKAIQILALHKSNEDNRNAKVYANDLIEEGMKFILDKYKGEKQ